MMLHFFLKMRSFELFLPLKDIHESVIFDKYLFDTK